MLQLTFLCLLAAQEVAAQAVDSMNFCDGIATSLVISKRTYLRTCLLGFLFRSSACCKLTLVTISVILQLLFPPAADRHTSQQVCTASSWNFHLSVCLVRLVSLQFITVKTVHLSAVQPL